MNRIFFPALIFVAFIASPGSARAADYSQYDRVTAVINFDAGYILPVRDRLYALDSNGVAVFDVSDPGGPRLVGTGPMEPGLPESLALHDSLLIAQNSGGTYLFQVGDDLQIQTLSHVPETGPVTISDGNLLVGVGPVVAVYDLADPTAPRSKPAIDIGGRFLGGLQDDVLTRREEYGIGYVDLYLERRTVTDGEIVSEPVVVASYLYRDYGTDWSCLGYEKTADRTRLEMRETAPDYWGPYPVTRVVAFRLLEFPPDGPQRRTAASALTQGSDEWFRTTNDVFDYRTFVVDGCDGRCLEAIGREGTAAAGESFLVPACSNGSAVGAGDRLYVSTGHSIQVRTFSARGVLDTTRIIDGNATHDVRSGQPGRGGFAWITTTMLCTGFGGTHGDEFPIWDEDRFTQVIPPPPTHPHAVEIRTPYEPTAALAYSSDLIVYGLRSVYFPPSALLSFQHPGDTEPYLTIAEVPVDALVERNGKVVLASGTRLREIDLGDPALPQLSAGTTLPAAFVRLAAWSGGVVGARADGSVDIVVDDGDGTWRLATTLPAADGVSALHVEGMTLGVATGNRITFYDLSNPDQPQPAGAVEFMAPVRGFVCSGSIVYAACGDVGMLVYRRTAPDASEYLGGYQLDDCRDVALRGDQLLVAAAHGTFLLPLQDGDPLPAYDPQLSASMSKDGKAIIKWRPHADNTAERLEKRCGGSRTILPHTTGPGGFREASDPSPSGSCPSVTYVLYSTGDEGAWYEAARATLALPAARILLETAEPNPFNPCTTLRYRVPTATHVHLAIYDVRGRRVRDLVDARVTAGSRTEEWNGRDDGGRLVAAGTYVARLDTETATRTTKLTLLK